MAAACHKGSIEMLGLRYNPPPVIAVLSLIRMAAMIAHITLSCKSIMLSQKKAKIRLPNSIQLHLRSRMNE
jgi:hypothetical protein